MINYGQTNPMAKALAIMYCISFGGHIIVVHYLVSTYDLTIPFYALHDGV